MRGVAEALASRGLDVPALFAEAGLDLHALDHPERRYPSERIAQLWELAVQRSGDRCIGLADPDMPQPGNFDVVGYAMMSAPHVRAALERLVRYLRIVSDAALLTLQPQDGGCWIRLDLFSGGRPTPQARYDYDLSALLGFLRWITGRELRPRAMATTQPRPDNTAPYEAVFRCGLHFGAHFNGLLLDDADLALALPASNAELSELHDRLAGSHLLRLQSSRTADRAHDALTRQLPGGEPRRSQIAALLAMSDHTLQRRLAAEGTHFTALVDQTRRELAQHYLAQPGVSLAQVTYLLGFGDQSNLFRACMRWFGQAPGRFRHELLQIK